MCPSDLVMLVSGLSISIAKDKTDSEIELISAIFMMLGDSLATYLVQKSICEENIES